MARLTEEMVIARSKQSDLSAIRKLNCWGAELGDVTLLQRMPNLEVLALSINKIRSLEQFAACARLRELYVRKNEIRDLRQLRHLRRLPLRALWLEENPCARLPQYRATVLRNLPHLEKLDNVPVTPEEVSEAMRSGQYIPDSDEERSPSPSPSPSPGVAGGGGGRHSPSPSPEREPPPDHAADGSEPVPDSASSHQQWPLSPTRSPPAPPAPERLASPPAALSRSHYDERERERERDRERERERDRERPADTGSLRHSVSALSVKEYAYCNGAAQHEPYSERPHDRTESYGALPREWEREGARGERGERERDREYPSAVMAERRGFTRRPVARNSNLLSAVLCLLKELDYPSLEVAEMAVRCRMDELAESQ